jgi:hypothetical protein
LGTVHRRGCRLSCRIYGYSNRRRLRMKAFFSSVANVAPGNILSAVPLEDDWLERAVQDANMESQQIPVG